MEYALGMIETHGHTAAIEALDAASKASNIILPSMVHVGSGRIAVSFFGDVSAVKVAVDCGVAAAEKVGKVLGSNVIARLDKQVLDTLFAYASSNNNNTVEDGNKEIKENEENNSEEKEAEEKQTEENEIEENQSHRDKQEETKVIRQSLKGIDEARPIVMDQGEDPFVKRDPPSQKQKDPDQLISPGILRWHRRYPPR